MNKGRIVSVLAVSASIVSFAFLTGCGAMVGGTAAPASVTLGAVSGRVHGVPNPVTGATVTLYETQVGATTSPSGGVSGYGDTTPKQLGQVTTGSDGSFLFTAGYTCDTSPYMQYAYVTVTGGDSGAGTNNNLVLMAALGPCSTLSNKVTQAATQVFISEATTVAAAYALGNFTTVTGALGSQVVNISSSPTNDATTPTCTNVSGLLNSCVADGLGHAFLLATNLASGVGTLLAPPTGLFNTTISSYPGSVIPQQMLNVVAAAMQSCTNSTGGGVTSGASDGTACGNLFLDTTPSGGNAPAGAAAPTDTLSAMIDLARYPDTPTAIGTGGIYSLVGPYVYYSPQVQAPPVDYTLALFYPGTSNGTVYAPYTWALALDIGDNVYLEGSDNNTPPTFGTTPTAGNITTTGLWEISQGPTGATPGYTYTTAPSTTLLSPGNVAVDSQGNVFVSNPAPTPANLIREFSASAGTLTTTYSPTTASGTVPINFPGSIAIDKNNQLWTATQNPTPSQTTYDAALYQIPLTGTAVSGITPANTTNFSKLASDAQGDFNGVAIDQYQNAWTCGNGSGTNGSATGTNTQPKLIGFPNTGGGAGTKLYNNVPPTPSGQLGGNPIGGPAIDSYGFAYCPNRKQVMMGVPGSTGSIGTAPTVSIETFLTGQAPDLSAGAETDGSGNYIQVGRGSGHAFIAALAQPPTATSTTFLSTFSAFEPCFPQLSMTTGEYYCSDDATDFPPTGTQPSFQFLNSVNSFQIDSMGGMWITLGTGSPVNPNTPNGVMDLVGPAGPTWPQLSYTRPGVKP